MMYREPIKKNTAKLSEILNDSKTSTDHIEHYKPWGVLVWKYFFNHDSECILRPK